MLLYPYLLIRYWYIQAWIVPTTTTTTLGGLNRIKHDLNSWLKYWWVTDWLTDRVVLQLYSSKIELQLLHINYISIDAVVTIALSSCNSSSRTLRLCEEVTLCHSTNQSPGGWDPSDFKPPHQSLARLSVSVSSRTIGVPRPGLRLSLVQVPIMRLVLVSFNVQGCERSHLMSRTETFLSSVLMPLKNALFGQINLFIDTNAKWNFWYWYCLGLVGFWDQVSVLVLFNGGDWDQS